MRYDRQLEGRQVLLLGRESPLSPAVRDLFIQHGATVKGLDSRETWPGVPADGYPDSGGAEDAYDVLITLFAGAAWGMVPEVSEQDMQPLLHRNARNAFACIQRVLPDMKRTGGAIVHVLPMYAQKTVPGTAAVAMVAGGIAALSRATAIEYGKFGIRSNCLLAGPGFFSCPEGAMPHDAQLLEANTRFSELANAVLYLAGGMSGHVTGEWLPMDGGASVIAHNQLYERGGWFA